MGREDMQQSEGTRQVRHTYQEGGYMPEQRATAAERRTLQRRLLKAGTGEMARALSVDGRGLFQAFLGFF